MSAAVGIGDPRRLAGYRLAGAEIRPAMSAAEAEAAWYSLGGETVLLELTPEAHDALAARLAERMLVWAVVPS